MRRRPQLSPFFRLRPLGSCLSVARTAPPLTRSLHSSAGSLYPRMQPWQLQQHWAAAEREKGRLSHPSRRLSWHHNILPSSATAPGPGVEPVPREDLQRPRALVLQCSKCKLFSASRGRRSPSWTRSFLRERGSGSGQWGVPSSRSSTRLPQGRPLDCPTPPCGAARSWMTLQAS